VGAVEYAGATLEPALVERHGHAGARARDCVVDEGVDLVVRAEDDVPAIPALGGVEPHAELVEGALRAVVGDAAMADVEQAANGELAEPEIGPDGAGPIGVRIAEDVGVVRIDGRIARSVDVERAGGGSLALTRSVVDVHAADGQPAAAANELGAAVGADRLAHLGHAADRQTG